MLQVGKSAPDFSAEAVMSDGNIKEVKLSNYRDKKNVLLIFYPFDFTFVCPTEILSFSKAVPEFEKKDVQILGCSVDSTFVHTAWRNTKKNAGGIENISFPLLSDVTRKIAESYNVLHDKGMANRGVFFIDKKGILQYFSVNNLSIGRSVDEIMRIVSAIQFHEKYGDVCPANWKEGSAAIQPNSKGIADYLSKKF